MDEDECSEAGMVMERGLVMEWSANDGDVEKQVW